LAFAGDVLVPNWLFRRPLFTGNQYADEPRRASTRR